MSQDFIALEQAVSKAYFDFKKASTPESRNEIFVAIKNLAYAVLLVGDWGKYGVDYKTVSYEYSLYMFERIVTGTFSPSDSFPWTEYVRKSIRYGVMAVKNDHLWYDFVEKEKMQELSEELKETFIDENAPDLDYEIDQGKFGERIYAILRRFYSRGEINRLYPLASDVIYSNPDKPISDNLPLDLQDFLKVLISAGKRLDTVTEVKFKLNDISVETFRKALHVSVRNTLFLASIVKKNYFPRDKLLSHDIDSLFRELQITGNTALLKRLERLMGAVVTASNMLLDGKSYEDALESAREELDFELGAGAVKRMVSGIIEIYYLFRDGKESDPLIDVMLSIFNVMQALADKLPDIIDAGVSVDSVVKLYREVSVSLNNLTNSLVKISFTSTEKESKKLMDITN